MIDKKHPVDKVFSKGLADYTVSPSADAKKKLFAVPEAIQPIKPWYVSSKYFLYISSAVIIFSAITYFSFFRNESNTTITNNENTLANNSVFLTNEQTNKEYNVSNNNSITKEQENKNHEIPEENKETNLVTPVSETKETKNEAIYKNAKDNNTINNQENKVINNDHINEESTVYSNTDVNINPDIKSDGTEILSDENLAQDLSIENNSAIKESQSFELGISNSTSGFQDYSNIEYMKAIKPELSDFSYSDFVFKTKKEQSYSLKGFWFAEFKMGSFASNYKVNAKENEYENAAIAKQKLLQLSPGNDFQLNAIYQRNNFMFKAGLSYVSYGEKLSGTVLLTNPQLTTDISFNSNAPYDIIIGGNYYNIDTTGGYYHYYYTQTSHIEVSDSSWEWNTQNVLADVYDTTQHTIFDTLPENYSYNNIRFIEVPFSVGFVKPYGKFSLGISASLSPGVFVAVKGSNMDITNYPALENYQKNTLQKLIVSAGANFEIGYQINESIMLSFEPFYKRSLLKLYNESNKINQSFDSYGFRIGIRKLL